MVGKFEFLTKFPTILSIYRLAGPKTLIFMTRYVFATFFPTNGLSPRIWSPIYSPYSYIVVHSYIIAIYSHGTPWHAIARHGPNMPEGEAPEWGAGFY